MRVIYERNLAYFWPTNTMRHLCLLVPCSILRSAKRQDRRWMYVTASRGWEMHKSRRHNARKESIFLHASCFLVGVPRQQRFHGSNVARAGRSIGTGTADRAIGRWSMRPTGTALLCSLSSRGRGQYYISRWCIVPGVRGASRYVTPRPLAANKIIVGKWLMIALQGRQTERDSPSRRRCKLCDTFTLTLWSIHFEVYYTVIWSFVRTSVSSDAFE